MAVARTLAAGRNLIVLDELFLDPARRKLVPVIDGWRGPAEDDEPGARRARLGELEASVEALLAGERPAGSGKPRRRREPLNLLGPIRVAGESVLRFFQPRLFGASAVVLARALGQALLRPLLF